MLPYIHGMDFKRRMDVGIRGHDMLLMLMLGVEQCARDRSATAFIIRDGYFYQAGGLGYIGCVLVYSATMHRNYKRGMKLLLVCTFNVQSCTIMCCIVCCFFVVGTRTRSL